MNRAVTRLPALVGLCLLCHGLAAPLRPAAQAASPDVTDVSARAFVDRTAMWVADRVTYTVELTCKPSVEVLADDLSRDKLKLDGLEVVSVGTDRRAAPNGSTVHTYRYILTTYRVDGDTLAIAPFSVRYAIVRAGQRLEEARAAGDVQVPGAVLAFRSTLPDEPDVVTGAGIRSNRPPHARSRWLAALPSIGLGLIIVSIVPAAVAVAAAVRRTRRPRPRQSARAARKEERVSLEAVRSLDLTTVEARREAFTQLEGIVRVHLQNVCGIPGTALTPAEVPFALAPVNGKVPAELVESVLATCELARYAPAHLVPSADACRTAIEQAETIIATT